MINVLIIAYEFYPVNSGGSHRPFRIANFLKKNQIQPFIITADDEDLKLKQDSSLKQLLKDADLSPILVPLKKKKWYSHISKSYYINIVDHIYLRWKENLFQAIDELLNRTNLDCIYVTAPPFSITKAVADLKTRYNLPVLLDMRDAWLLWNVSPYASKVHYKLTKILERKALKASSKSLVTSEVTINDFKFIHPQIAASNYLYIPNSFDTYLEHKKDVLILKPKDKLKIGYVGSFYFNPASERLNQTPWYKKKPYQWFQYTPFKEKWLYRSPYFVFKSVKYFLEKNPEYKTRLELHFAGSKPAWFNDMVNEFNLEETVVHHGLIPKVETLQFQNQMDLLLLTSSKRNERKDYSIAGKTFEYFSQIKPILAYVTEGAQKDVLSKSGISILIDPDNMEQAAVQLKKIIDKGIQLKPDYNWMDLFLTENTLKPLLKEIDQT